MKALIAAYARTPFHFAKKGALAQTRPDGLAAQAVRGLLERTGVAGSEIEDVILGCAYPEAAQGNNLARIVGLLAGLPHSVPGMTVNRFAARRCRPCTLPPRTWKPASARPTCASAWSR